MKNFTYGDKTMTNKALKIELFTRDPDKKKVKKWHKKLDAFLRKNRIMVPPILTSANIKTVFAEWKKNSETKPDIMIVLGGDGTILEAAQLCAPYGIPLLGLNLGTMGFITTARKEKDFLRILKKVLAGKYFIEKRMMLNVKVIRNGKIVKTSLALNEAVVKNLRKVLEFDIFINRDKITEKPIRGDGVNICTPTGSTAYNFSLGGAVVEPEFECIIIKPIAPISINIRSMIVDKKKTISVKLSNSRNEENILTLDGLDETETKLCLGDIIEIKKARIKTLIIRTKEKHFWESINNLFGFFEIK